MAKNRRLYQKTLSQWLAHAHKQNAISKNIKSVAMSCPKILACVYSSFHASQSPSLSFYLLCSCVSHLCLSCVGTSASCAAPGWQSIYVRNHSRTLAWKFQFLLILFRKFHDVILALNSKLYYIFVLAEQ